VQPEETDATEVEVAKSFQSDATVAEAESKASEVETVEQSDVPTAEMNFQPAAETVATTEQQEVSMTEDSPVETVSQPEEVTYQTDRADSVEETKSWSHSTDNDEAISLSESDIQVDTKADTGSDYSVPAQKDYQFEQTPFESAESISAQKVFDSFGKESAKTESFVSEPAQSQPAVTTTAPARSRFSDRNVDLPIEVGEDERRLHNDARRFARLLVSEIKLYNEQKVKEGREAQDLYERLREAIDRSRDMYDKRVQPPVAAKFDYFHYELVSTLAEGEETKLGGGYPGAAIQ
jgi:hypothetical protein